MAVSVDFKQMQLAELTEKERKQIEVQRMLRFGKYEVHIEDSQPVRMVRLRENIKL